MRDEKKGSKKSRIFVNIQKKIKKTGTGKPVIKITHTGRTSVVITLET